MDKKIFWGIIIGIVFASLIYAGYSVYIIKQKQSYQQGYDSGTRDLIIKINQDEKIPVLSYNNQTGNSIINYVPIQTICGSSG